MPLLYEPTDRLARRIGSRVKLSPDFGSAAGIFLGGLVAGFIILPIALPVLGFQVQKRWGPPAKK